jgi:hypothetical protein
MASVFKNSVTPHYSVRLFDMSSVFLMNFVKDKPLKLCQYFRASKYIGKRQLKTLYSGVHARCRVRIYGYCWARTRAAGAGRAYPRSPL